MYKIKLQAPPLPLQLSSPPSWCIFLQSISARKRYTEFIVHIYFSSLYTFTIYIYYLSPDFPQENGSSVRARTSFFCNYYIPKTEHSA